MSRRMRKQYVQSTIDVSWGGGGERFERRIGMLTEMLQAKRAYLEALRKVEQMEKRPGLLERAGKVGRAFKTLLDLGSLMADLDPTGGAKAAFSVCTKAWEHLEQQESQDAELSELVKRMARTIPSIKSLQDKANGDLKETLMDMLNLIEDVSVFILSTRSRSPFGERHPTVETNLIQPTAVYLERAIRAAVNSDISEQFQTHISKFEELGKELVLRTGTQNLQIGEVVREHVEEGSKRAEVERTNARLRELKPADLAGYDPTRKCLSGTRVSIIDELFNWAQNSDSEPRLAWAHGLAGLGKSSIATSVCLRLDGQHILASSFFCKRDSPELRDPRRVLATIIYGLALRWEDYRDAVVGAIAEDPELHLKHIQPLYESLVSKPLRNLVGAKSPASTYVVVVDALDECGDETTRKQLLACLRGISQLNPWLRIIVTSRPDRDIREFFTHTGEDWFTEYNVLSYDARADVCILIEDCLSEVAQTDDWPKDAVEQLSLRSNGLFIWAQTACQFILNGFDRVKCLNKVLTGTHISDLSTDLDTLYATTVKTSAADGADEKMEYTLKCLGVVVVTATRTPLSVSSLAQLLGRWIPYKVLDRVLHSLSSVLYVDRNQGSVVRISHPSFMDYIIDSSRSKELCVDLKRHNTILAECCLGLMNEGLRFNICGLETSYLFNSQVPNLGSRVQDVIHPHLSYSCLYWSSHVADAYAGALDNCLRSFLFQTPLMYWIETLSLLGKLRTALSSLLQFAGCSVPDYMQDCIVVANDAYRFVMSFYDAISKSTPHLYISALALAPSNSGIARRMRPVFSKLLTVVQGAEKEWTPCLTSIWVGSNVWSVAVSPNGQRIASGSQDGTVQVWDAETGDVVLGSLNGHSGQVNCVAFSPDGRWIASASKDVTIRVWNAETGEPRFDPLRGHSHEVASVAFSPDGHRLVSGSMDETARVWELKTSQSVLELHGHSDCVRSIAFSPDGRRIASGSWDKTLRIWDAQAGGSALMTLRGHSDAIWSIAFSPDGHRIASSSHDCTIRIWDAGTGDMLLGPLHGHSDWLRSVAFSPDGRCVASSSVDKTVRIWDAQTGDLLAQPLDSHSDQVISVAFCPNGRIVSGSMDDTIRIWEAVDGNKSGLLSKQSNTSKGHLGDVHSVVFSSNGRSVVSGSSDRTVGIWDAGTGEPVQEPLEGHVGAVIAVAVSSDGRWIASGSMDETVCIWDAVTGNATLELEGHSDGVQSVAFSPDCRQVVSGSDDGTVRIWNVETGQAVLKPLSHLGEVKSVAFSPEGNRIASGSEDGSVRIWDSRTGQVMVKTPEFETEDHCVTSVAFSPNGHQVVYGSTDETLSVLDAKTGERMLGPLEVHPDWVASVAFSPDGRRIVSASHGSAIHIWDIQTGQSALELRGHTYDVTSIAFSPDGHHIVSGSWDWSVRIWDVGPRTLSHAASPKYLA
ncbi:POC1 centriolar protein A, partial [Ceratobasidium sp. 395]